MRIENEILLDFDDVLIKPKRSTLISRNDVSLERTFKFKNTDDKEWIGIPIMSSNMDTTGTIEIADILSNMKMFTCLHKYYELDDLYSYFFEPREYTAYSMGIGEVDVSKWKAVKSKLPLGNIKYVCIDVANGYTEKFVDFVKRFKDEHPDIVVIAGNVVTGDQTQELVLNGADIVKVGIGPGSVCTTRIQTGVGYPQLSAIIECADAAHGLGGHVVADGGCTTPGDVAKAFAAGSDFAMLGGMFAGHEESGGETLIRDGKMYKVFYGMSSKRANDTYNSGLKTYRAAEGKEVLVPFKGKIEDTAQEILGGVRSTCTYVGANTIKQLFKCATFVRVSRTHNKIFS